MKLFIPQNYEPLLDVNQTEKAIKLVKDSFQQDLASELRLRRVTAPLFVMKGTGINDDLNGIERPVTFPVKELGDHPAEVVHSLAKWKRMTLADLNIGLGYGLYTDMNAIRPDEELTNIHSLYCDQWDWERVVSKEERTLDFLKKIVRKIYSTFKALYTMRSYLLALFFLLTAATASAHPMPASVVKLSVIEKSIKGEAKMPLPELESAVNQYVTE